MKKVKTKPKPKTKVKVKPKKSKAKVKKVPPKAKNRQGKPIGAVTHYFSDIKVAVIKLSAPLAAGQEIRIMGGENTDFNQKATSMQIDHQEVKKAAKGNSVGLKIREKVREGYKVYKV